MSIDFIAMFSALSLWGTLRLFTILVAKVLNSKLKLIFIFAILVWSSKIFIFKLYELWTRTS